MAQGLSTTPEYYLPSQWDVTVTSHVIVRDRARARPGLGPGPGQARARARPIARARSVDVVRESVFTRPFTVVLCGTEAGIWFDFSKGN